MTPWAEDSDLLIYRMWEIQILLIRDKESLAPEAGPLTDAKRADFLEKISQLDCNDLPEIARRDCAAWKAAILTFLHHPPASGFDFGYRIGQIQDAYFVPMFVDLDITARKAQQDLAEKASIEYQEELVRSIGAALSLEKAKLLIGLDLQPGCPKEARLEAYFFVIYQVLGIVMHASAKGGDRPVCVRAQASLLAIDPWQVAEDTECGAFVDVHRSLLKVSREIKNGNLQEAETCLMESFVFLTRVVKDTNLSDQDVIEAGGEMVLDYLRMYRGLNL